MEIKRQTLSKIGARMAPGLALGRSLRAETGLEIQKGPFEGTQESLRRYQVPDWYRDAKFGIWAHWGPQSSVEQGDWYARNMYIQGSRHYAYHIAHYGHPSKVGFKDLCHLWKASEFDPDYLMGLYKRAGARYFVSMGVHHDNFDLWNSQHTRWNAVKVGPHKDMVGLWRTAAVKHGLRFGVSEHLWISYKWFAVSHGSDRTGPLAGVPYDGMNPAYADLYHDEGAAKWVSDNPEQFGWDENGIPDAWKRHWFLRIRDLVDHYQPDLLHTDGPLPFEHYGYSVAANLCNLSATLHGGQAQAVYTSKSPEDCAVGTCVLDFEGGLENQVRPSPWESDISLGDWHYDREVYEQHRYKSTKTVVDMLVDVVSQNGNVLLNVPLRGSGQPDSEELKVLAGITDWMKVNSEGIYGTRPWKIYGEGPGTHGDRVGGGLNENKRQPLTPEDVRFTQKEDALYAFVMGWPDKEALVRALGTGSAQSPGKIVNVELLGFRGRLKWTQEAAGLKVQLPAERPSDYAVTLKIAFA
jgi:alpha-L-fucosidase